MRFQRIPRTVVAIGSALGLSAVFLIVTPSAASASPAQATAPAAAVAAYTSQCGEPPVPDTPLNDGPEGMFGGPCHNHDICYYGTSGYDRATCDARFYVEMVNQCNAHYSWWDPRRGMCTTEAQGYYLAVRVFGRYYWWGPPSMNN